MALHAMAADDCPGIGQDHGAVLFKDEAGHHFHLFEDALDENGVVVDTPEETTVEDGEADGQG